MIFTNSGIAYNILLVYATAVLWFPSSTYGPGTGPILLDNVRCAGTETSLQQCVANPIGDHNCGRYDDTGVRCEICLHVHVQLVLIS